MTPLLSFGRRVGLLIFGTILALVCLEIVLRIGGVFYATYDKGIHKDINHDSGVHNILCLGDSFTYGFLAGKEQDYPTQLEKILNASGPTRKYSVINKGRPGQNSSELLANLDRNLKRYDPDLVIVMTGFNDSFNPHLHYRALNQSKWHLKIFSWISGLRVYKMLNYLRLSLRNTYYTWKTDKRLPDKEKDPGNINSSRDIEGKKEYIKKKIIELLESGRDNEAKALIMESLTADNVWEYVNLVKKYKLDNLLEVILKTALANNPSDENLRVNLGRLYVANGKLDSAEKLFKQVIESNPRNNCLRFEFSELYMKQKRYADAESLLQEQIEVHGETLLANTKLLDCYKKQGKTEKVKILEEKIRPENKITDINAIRIINKISDRGTQLIIMNYPRSDYISRDILRGTNFVDNRQEFDNIPENKKKHLFAVDNVHCSGDGNRIIAENVMNHILKLEESKRD